MTDEQTPPAEPTPPAEQPSPVDAPMLQAEHTPPAEQTPTDAPMPQFDPPGQTGYVFRSVAHGDDARTGYFFDSVAPVAATGATAGTPGAWTPAGAQPPLSSMAGITASPATNWTPGQYVQTRDNSNWNWNGTAWVAGIHP